MIEIWALAAAWVLGMDARRIALIAVAVLAPVASSVLVIYAVWRGRRSPESKAASFCVAAASELRAGSSLRHALEASARSVGIPTAAELADAGGSLEEVARALAGELPEIGPELTVILAPAHRSGASIADLFDEIGSLAIAQAEVAAEVRMSTAPVRASVTVLVLAPLAFLAMRGGIPDGFASGEGIAAVAGAGLFAAGLWTVIAIMRRGI